MGGKGAEKNEWEYGLPEGVFPPVYSQDLKKKLETFFTAFFAKFSDDRTLTLAASLSFYTVLSLAPLAVVVLFAFSRIDISLFDRFVLEMKDLVGEAGGGAIESAIESARKQPLAGSFASFLSLCVVLISASAMFGEIRASLAILLRSPPVTNTSTGYFQKTWSVVRDRLLSIGFALTVVLIMAVSLVLSAVLSATAQKLGFMKFELAISFATYSAVFTLLLMYGTKKGLKFRDALRGGVATGVLFIVGKILIGLYIGNSSAANSYGAAGSVVALLVWIYYAVIIVFSGAHLAWLVADKKYLTYGMNSVAPSVAVIRKQNGKRAG